MKAEEMSWYDLRDDQSLKGREFVWKDQSGKIYKGAIERIEAYPGFMEVASGTIHLSWHGTIIVGSRPRAWANLGPKELEPRSTHPQRQEDGSIIIDVFKEGDGQILPENHYYPPKKVIGGKPK